MTDTKQRTKMKLSAKNLLAIIFFLFFGGFVLKIFIQLLPVILFLIISTYVLNSNKSLITKIKKYFLAEKHFENQFGQVYKYCSFCDKKADRKAKKCDNCGKAFE